MKQHELIDYFSRREMGVSDTYELIEEPNYPETN